MCPPDALNYIYFDLKSEFSFFCLLKGITTEKPNPPSDSKDENGNETKKPSPPPTPLQKIVKSPPSTKQNSKIPSIKCINYIFFFLSKGITTEKPDPPSDSEDEDGNETKKPRPPPPPPQKIVKSPPSTKRNSKIPSIKSPTETVKEPEKWIDYRGK